MSDPIYRDRELQALLETLDPLTRDALRRILIQDQADRDAVASQLLGGELYASSRSSGLPTDGLRALTQRRLGGTPSSVR